MLTKFKLRPVCSLCKHFVYDAECGSIYCGTYGMSYDVSEQSIVLQSNVGCSLHEFTAVALQYEKENKEE